MIKISAAYANKIRAQCTQKCDSGHIKEDLKQQIPNIVSVNVVGSARLVRKHASSQNGTTICIVEDFERGQIIGLGESVLSCREIAARVRKNANTVMRTCRQWTEDVFTHCRDGSGAHMAMSESEDWHLLLMAETNRTAASTTLAQQWRMVTNQAMSASTVPRRMLPRGLVARRPLLRLPLTPNHSRQRLQWYLERRHWDAK